MLDPRLRLALGLAMLAAGAAGCGRETAPPTIAADNVVLIVVDTLRADRLGCYGYPRDTSPVLDRMAAEGVLFTAAYATSPWTFPSMASVVTALHPDAHGGFIEGRVRNNTGASAPTPLAPAFETLPEVLERAGVATALVGANGYLEFGVEQGFGEVTIFIENAERRASDAVRWIEGLPRERRFFLLLHFIDPHEPNRPPERHRRLFSAGAALDEEGLERHAWWGPFWSRPEGWEHESFAAYRAARTDLYDASVRFVDEQIGAVLAAVAAARPDQQTAFLVTADHGEEFWDHAEVEHASFGDPRAVWGVGHGHTLFEELVRIPLVLHWPGALAPRVVDAPASHVDLLPTILDLLDVPDGGAPRQGVSLLEAACGRPGADRPLFFSQPCFGKSKTGVLDGRLKLLRSPGEPTLLYDLVADPHEREDLAAVRPDDRRRLEGLLGEAIGRSRALGRSVRGPGEAPAAELSPEQLERLRALGYAR